VPSTIDPRGDAVDFELQPERRARIRRRKGRGGDAADAAVRRRPPPPPRVLKEKATEARSLTAFSGCPAGPKTSAPCSRRSTRWRSCPTRACANASPPTSACRRDRSRRRPHIRHVARRRPHTRTLRRRKRGGAHGATSLTSRRALRPQVWFQNRRQRSKSKEPQLSQPPLLAGHDQVLFALFDVSEGALPPEVRARVAMGSRCGTGGDLLASSAVAAGPAASAAAAAQLSAGAGGAMPLAAAPLAAAAVAEEGAGRLPFNLSFEWGLPSAGAFLPSRGAAPSLAAPSLAAGLVPSPLDSLQPLPSLGGASVALGAVPATLGAACGREPHAAEPTSAAPPSSLSSSLPQSGLHAPAAPPGGRVGPSAPLAAAAAVGGEGGGLAPPPPMVLEAQMGYICHVLRLAAMDYSLVSASAPSSLLQTYAPDGAAVLNSLAWCLTPRLDPAGVRAARLFTPAGCEQVPLPPLEPARRHRRIHTRGGLVWRLRRAGGHPAPRRQQLQGHRRSAVPRVAGHVGLGRAVRSAG